MAAESEARIKVFVSYSRADKAFANDLVLGLAACGFAPYIDRQDIAAGEDWEKRLEGLIAEADSIVYIVSPDSLASENCGQEFRQALDLRKRILPVVWRAVDDAAAPPEMKRLNYIFFSGEGRTFAAGLAELAAALRTDIGWIREHTRLAELAGRWAARGRPAGMLLRGDDIDAADAWLKDKPIAAPAVTDDQADFIKASSDARVEAERRARRARAGLLTAVSAVAVVFAVLAGVAAWQWSVAKDGEATIAGQLDTLEKQTAEIRAANLRLGAEVWLRTAPSDSGYYVVDSGWYPVVASHSGAIARVLRAGGGNATTTSTGFLIDGALVHERYAGEPLLMMLGDDTPPLCDSGDPILDTLPPDACQQTQMQQGDNLSDTLSADDRRRVQTMISDTRAKGEERVVATFPSLSTKDSAPEAVQTGERIWKTPDHVAAVQQFQIRRLASAPPEGWTTIKPDDIDCTGDLETRATVAMLGIAVPRQQGPTPRALALNISERLGMDLGEGVVTYTHSTNVASGGAPVFDLATGKVFAVHIGSEPEPVVRNGDTPPPAPRFRRGFGYPVRDLFNVIRSEMKQPPLCGT